MNALEILEKLDAIEFLAQTKTSRRSDKLIDTLQRKLDRIAQQIKTELLTSNVVMVRQKFQKQVHDLIRFGVEDAYFLGLDYSNKALAQRQEITINDIQKIDKITRDIENRFWNLVSRIEHIKEFSFSFFLSTISTMISDAIIKTLNTATLANAEPIKPEDFKDVVQVMFKTREDERVCPICEPLNNNVYAVNDDSKPEIPDDTHFGCRCRYLVYDKGEFVAG